MQVTMYLKRFFTALISQWIINFCKDSLALLIAFLKCVFLNRFFSREAASNNEAMAMILLQNLLIQVDEQLDRVSQEKNLLLIHNLKRIRKLLQVGCCFR